ncbi:MAG: ATP-binding cassette domain-containing protein [Clostridiales bacterium]|jgi:NHLM bacteriocin system ABC transporter ATP-binding protein|nr:ATP-binding cassette domain-containing protein [Clostridiales bacterium]
MGLYDDQIKQRIKADNDSFAHSFAELAGSVMGGAPFAELADAAIARNAIEAVLKYYKLPAPDIPESVTELDKQLDYALSRSGLAKRKVALTKGWQKEAAGAFLGSLKDGTAVALIPGRAGSYYYHDIKQNKNIKIDAKTELGEAAYCFYKPLPAGRITAKAFFAYVFGLIRVKDLAWLGITALAAALAGLVTPYVTEKLFGDVLTIAELPVLLAAAAMLIGSTASSAFIGIAAGMAQEHIGQKARITVGAAMYMRILSLKPKFFRDKPAGEVMSRMSQAESLCDMITVGLVVSSLTAVFSLVYIGQIFTVARPLAIPALIVTGLGAALSVIQVFVTMKYRRDMIEAGAAESGITMSLFSGVLKLKLAGAEKRVFAKWSSVYSKNAKLQYLPPVIVRFGGLFMFLLTSGCTLFFYYAAAASNVSVAEYMAFNAAFGMASGALSQFTGIAGTITHIRSMFKSLGPIFDEEPESGTGGTIVERLSGVVELNNVSFRYADNMPLVLDNLSLKIRAGQYVAICGATGCGKSTLMRLMLGFETPQKGAVYYDGKDLEKLDKKSMRRASVGVVLQNGSLFQGDIFSNIIISAPWLTQDDAWEAAEIAGIAEDIRAMPMGMHTMISEGSGGVSGGQKQRLMIARAVAGKPKILMLDEATSALDNITQKHVSESLAKLKCTRIVIAHRLSTIRECDRIIMLGGGRIVGDGTYDELIAGNKPFAELVERQKAE